MKSHCLQGFCTIPGGLGLGIPEPSTVYVPLFCRFFFSANVRDANCTYKFHCARVKTLSPNPRGFFVATTGNMTLFLCSKNHASSDLSLGPVTFSWVLGEV